jgi:hypothetical protein
MPAAKISFSQYQMWKGCHHRWKLNYIDKVDVGSPSLALVFGTAMHEVLQMYIELMYRSTIQEANELPLEILLQEKMQEEYKKYLEENDGEHFSDKDEMQEYLMDGIEIIRWFKAKRDEFFTKTDWELLGIELPINIVPVETHPTVRLVGFLDLVMKNKKTGKIHIYDFKTSTSGWNKYTKADKIKVSQLVLYKTFYAKQFDIHPDDIVVEYLILKRKINEDAEYAAMRKRVQRFEPSHGKVSQSQILKEIQNFVVTNFDEEGNKRTDVFYAPIAGENGKNCRWCEFKDRDDLCPKINRIKE